MITFFYKMIWNNRSKAIYIAFILVYLLLLILVVYDGDLQVERIANHAYYQIIYHEKIRQFLSLFMPIMIISLMIEHDQVIFTILVAYFSRFKIIMMKIIGVIWAVILIYIVTLILVYGFNHFNYSIYGSSIEKFDYMLYYGIESIIMVLLVILLSKRYQKMKQLLMVGIVIMIHFMQQSLESLFIFYLIPFSSFTFRHYQHTLYYLIAYSLLLVMMNIIHSEYQSLDIIN